MSLRRVVVAFDKLKGSLTATEATSAMTDALRSLLAGTEIFALPLADGGEGTTAAVLSAGGRWHEVPTVGALGQPVRSGYAVHEGKAYVELAESCGLPGVRRPTPDTALAASTYGVGLVIAAALDDGIREIVLGLGGSASTDGGAGLLSALGATLTDVRGRPVPPGGRHLSSIATLDLVAVRERLADVRVTLASDVASPLGGPEGAAALYAPQKGADPAAVEILAAGLEHWADLLSRATGTDLRDAPCSGAAGGTGLAALAVLGAEPRLGADVVLDLLHVDDLLSPDTLVITGEGSLDRQSLVGKGPVRLAERARDAGATTIAVAGRASVGLDDLRPRGITQLHTLRELAADDEESMRRASDLLADVAQQIAARLAPER